ncbi:conserved hypothetical protein [Stenotrophomonas sp. SKA14]|nr:conserved hypothetical protein [Stenotrophomonas sp. SKA14]
MSHHKSTKETAMTSKLEPLIHTATKKMRNWLRRWDRHLADALRQGNFRVTPEGIVVFDDKVLRNAYFHRVVGRDDDYTVDHNLLVDQGIMKALGVMFFTDAKIPAWYLTMGNGAANPGAGLTAANFASTLGEITSTTEGWSNTTRPKWNPAAPAANVISNVANKAQFNIVCATSIKVTCGMLVSSDVRGGTDGTLWSAARFSNERELYNGEVFELGYQTSLTG